MKKSVDNDINNGMIIAAIISFLIVVLLIPYFGIMAIFNNYEVEYVSHLSDLADWLFYWIRPLFVLSYDILFGIYILKSESIAKKTVGIFSFISVGIYYCLNAVCKVMWLFADRNILGFMEIFKDICKGIFADLCGLILAIFLVFVMFSKRVCRKKLITLLIFLYFLPLIEVIQNACYNFENNTIKNFADAFNDVFCYQPELLFLHIPLIVFSFSFFKKTNLIKKF